MWKFHNSGKHFIVICYSLSVLLDWHHVTSREMSSFSTYHDKFILLIFSMNFDSNFSIKLYILLNPTISQA